MGFDSSEFSFGGIAPVQMQRHQLVLCVTLFLDSFVVFYDGFSPGIMGSLCGHIV